MVVMSTFALGLAGGCRPAATPGAGGLCGDSARAVARARSLVTEQPKLAEQMFVDSYRTSELTDAWIVSFRFRREQRPQEGMIFVRKADCVADGPHGK
jgi:hypothetical protein